MVVIASSFGLMLQITLGLIVCGVNVVANS
jgi:hypothetical protein